MAWPVSHANDVGNNDNVGVGVLEHVVGVLGRKLEVEGRSCGITGFTNGFSVESHGAQRIGLA